jgi:repressor LexA
LPNGANTSTVIDMSRTGGQRRTSNGSRVVAPTPGSSLASDDAVDHVDHVDDGVPTVGADHVDEGPAVSQLTTRQRMILEVIERQQRERGFPPSVREIGEAVGLTSPSTVHSHLLSLQRMGFLRRDPSKPRAIEVRYDAASGMAAERRPFRHVPLVGDVAAGTDVLASEHVEELVPVPTDFAGNDGELFMLRVRGDSMIEAGILDGDYVVVRQQPTVDNGDVVVAGIPGEEATVKTYTRRGGKVTLLPANSRLAPMVYDADEIRIYGRVVTVLRRL